MEDPRRPLAVIIGIADYAQPRLRLTTPTRDADALAAQLAEHHGYEVRLVTDRDATRAALVELFEQSLPQLLDEARPLLVYFAGHGTATDAVDEPRGYLLPVDATDDPATQLAMADLARALALLPCRHLLLVLDCCFAGAFRWSAGRDIVAEAAPAMYRERYEHYLATPAWQVLTSAAHDEQAADYAARSSEGSDGAAHSPFLAAMLRGLAGAADISPRRADGSVGDGVITATELYLYLREQLASGPQPQTPGLWVLPRHRKGEYVLYAPGRAMAMPDAPTLSAATSPYRGSAAYDERHAPVFRGRRAATAAVRRMVERHPRTVIVGASGAGKTSLVRAGLLPALRRAQPDWQLVAARVDARGVEDALAARCAVNCVLVLDPLDDLFDDERSEERTAILAQLRVLTETTGLRVVATVRGDLAAKLDDGWARFALGDMAQDELRAVIEGPAEHHGLVFEPPSLVDKLINRVVGTPGALALLSFMLQALYVELLERATNDRVLRERAASGPRLERAMRARAEQLYLAMAPAARETVRRVMLRLVDVEGGAPARRRIALEELDASDVGERQRIEEVIDALTGTRVAGGPRLAVRGAGRTLELAHDAMLRSWSRLHEWLRADEPYRHVQRALAAAVAQWHGDGQHAGYLWRDDPRLVVAERLGARPHQLTRREAVFVARSRAARRKRGAVRGAAWLAALAIAAGVNSPDVHDHARARGVEPPHPSAFDTAAPPRCASPPDQLDDLDELDVDPRCAARIPR